MRKPYLIRTPSFEATSGGIRVMYGLYGWLLAKGEIVYLNAQIPNTETVGIYPEIYHGNDMQASTVVRYILQTPGVMGTGTQSGEFKLGPKEFDKNDKIYVFSKIYDTFGVDSEHLLFLPIINTKIFKDKKKKRTKTCYLVGKGSNLNKHPSNSIEITRDFANDQEALAELLNECHTIYVYDRLSAMMEVARLCGVKVRYYGELDWNLLKEYEPGMNGIGYHDNEAELDVEAFRNNYEGMVSIFSLKLDKFIEETQQ